MRTDVAFAVPMANVYRNLAPSSSRGTGELVLQLLDVGGHVQRQDALQVLTRRLPRPPCLRFALECSPDACRPTHHSHRSGRRDAG